MDFFAIFFNIIFALIILSGLYMSKIRSEESNDILAEWLGKKG